MGLVFLVGGVAVSMAALAYGRNAAQQSFDRLLVGAASQIAESISVRDGTIEVDLPVSAFELLSLASNDRITYAIRDGNGRLVTGYDLPRGVPEQAFFSTQFRGETFRVARVTRSFSERGYVGTVEVLVGQTLLARQELARQITRNAVILAGCAGVAMAGLAIFAVRSALAPLRRVERDISARAVDDLTPVAVAIPNEIHSLVATLNRFMRRIDRQIEAMRTLIADASHQLRTPVAAIRVQAELAKEETDPDRLRAILDRIYHRTQNLSHLTDQLLNHAMIIHRADFVPLERVDLRTVAIRAMDETDHALFGTVEKPGLELPEDPVWCRADPLSLIEAIKNLLGNALRHGVAPVTLVVSAGVEGQKIAVRDAGPGIPEASWQDIGVRYARASGVSAESASLGLAIVHAVAEAHRGRLEFSNSGQAFEARLVLPPVDGPRP